MFENKKAIRDTCMGISVNPSIVIAKAHWISRAHVHVQLQGIQIPPRALICMITIKNINTTQQRKKNLQKSCLGL